MDREKLDNWIAHLRNKTVANGATAGEAANAAEKVAELERKYGRPGPGADFNRRPRPPQPRGTLLVLSAPQHAALRRGQTVTLLRQGTEHRYRIADGFLWRDAGAGGETRHRIVSEQPNCRNVLVRYA